MKSQQNITCDVRMAAEIHICGRLMRWATKMPFSGLRCMTV
jgi:hypothetical protein